MDKKAIEYMMEKAALKTIWDEALHVDDVAGGNIDDAFSAGVDTGEIVMARQLLLMMGVSHG